MKTSCFCVRGFEVPFGGFEVALLRTCGYRTQLESGGQTRETKQPELLVTQGHHRIDAHGAARGQESCKQTDRDHDCSGNDNRKRAVDWQVGDQAESIWLKGVVTPFPAGSMRSFIRRIKGPASGAFTTA